MISNLCRRLLNRELLQIKIKKQPIDGKKLKAKTKAFMQLQGISEEEASYFVFQGKISNKAYNEDHQQIKILKKNGKVTDLIKESDQLSLKVLSETVTKYYCCYPKNSV